MTRFDMPLKNLPKCAHCGRAKNQHRARTLECPEGKRTPTGYSSYKTDRFKEAEESPDGPAKAAAHDQRILACSSSS
jgi:hypothetical protein